MSKNDNEKFTETKDEEFNIDEALKIDEEFSKNFDSNDFDLEEPDEFVDLSSDVESNEAIDIDDDPFDSTKLYMSDFEKDLERMNAILCEPGKSNPSNVFSDEKSNEESMAGDKPNNDDPANDKSSENINSKNPSKFKNGLKNFIAKVSVFDENGKFRWKYALAFVAGATSISFLAGGIAGNIGRSNYIKECIKPIEAQVCSDIDIKSFNLKRVTFEGASEKENETLMVLTGKVISIKGNVYDSSDIIYSVDSMYAGFIERAATIAGINLNEDKKNLKKRLKNTDNELVEFLTKTILEAIKSGTPVDARQKSTIPVASKNDSIVLYASKPAVVGDKVSYAVRTLTIDQNIGYAVKQQYIVSFDATDELKKDPKKVFLKKPEEAFVEVVGEETYKLNEVNCFCFVDSKQKEKV